MDGRGLCMWIESTHAAEVASAYGRRVAARVAGLGLWVLALQTVPAAAATITVHAGGDLQAALNRAAPGDTILLEAGATFIGNFTLPLTSGDTYITVRSASEDTAYPKDNERLTPAFAASLPKIRSNTSSPALRTAAGAHHWRLMFLEFQANEHGFGEIISLGSGKATSVSDQPDHIIIDRCYVHGDPIKGQKNGIVLHSRATEIRNSYIADIKGVGQETHAIWGANGPGPYTIANNYIEASGINIMFGGADPAIPNNVPGMARGEDGYGISVIGNHIRKNPDWFAPFVPTPAGVRAAGSEEGGALKAGKYSYRVAARVSSYQKAHATSTAVPEVSAEVASGTTGSVRVTWSPVADATYRVFGRESGALETYFDVPASACADGVCTFVDTGAAGASGSAKSGTRWLVKNLLELKIGQDVIVEGNTMEYNWTGAGDQAGYAVLLRSNPATDAGAAWTVVQRVVFENNHVLHSPGGINIIGTDGGKRRQAVRANTVTVRNNLFEDIAPAAWGGGNARFASVAGANDVTFDHNTIIMNGPGVLASQANQGVSTSERFVYTNNMSRRGIHGLKGDSTREGTETLSRYFPGATFRGNVLAGAKGRIYPSGNFYPTFDDWQAELVDYPGGDYRLKVGSAYKGAGTDHRDLGANLASVAGAFHEK